MNRSSNASLASINAGINWLKKEVKSIVVEANPADIQIALRDVTCRPLNLMEIPDYQSKMKDADHELVEAEFKLQDEYNEFKTMLYHVLKAGYQLDILKVDEACRELDKLLFSEKEKSKTSSLLTDFPHSFQYSGSYQTAYTAWLLWEFVNYWHQQQWAFERLQSSHRRVAVWTTKFKEEIIQNHLQVALDNTGKSPLDLLDEEQLQSLPEEEKARLARKMNEYDQFKQALKESGLNLLTSVVEILISLYFNELALKESGLNLLTSEALVGTNIGESFPMGRIPRKDFYLYTSWILDEMDNTLAETWENWGYMLNEYY